MTEHIDPVKSLNAARRNGHGLGCQRCRPEAFRSRRNFSAWIGLVPKQHSSGGKDRLGSISKQGDRYLRGLFVAGALSVIRYGKIHGTKHRPWLTALLARKPTKVAAIALARAQQWLIYSEFALSIKS
jgi:transposase